MTSTLLTERCTPTIERRIRSAAGAVGLVNTRNASTFFEHGHWWVGNVTTGEQWSVHDAEDPGTIDGFDFERVTAADED